VCEFCITLLIRVSLEVLAHIKLKSLNHYLIITIINLRTSSISVLKHFHTALVQLSTTLNETIDNVENVYPPSTSSEQILSTNSIPTPTTITTAGDKRSSDENDGPHISKRLRSSCSQTSNGSNITTVVKWIPPTKCLVTRLQSQSSSLFQFILSLIHTIFPSTDNHLTDEHTHWLHSTISLYGHNNNIDKINILIETACKVEKINFVR
jgi:hypothetical protein